MKNSDGSRLSRSLVICVALIVLASIPFLSHARTRTLSTSVNIVNNSSHTIRNVYTSHPDADDWSADVLGDATITAGQSQNVGGIQCDGQQIKIIAEDEDGCFLSTTVTCGNSSTWTITNDTPRDCGF
jgi:hypothetical protein